MTLDSDVRACIDKSWDAGIQHAAEIAAEYMWHFMLEDIGSNDEDAELAAIDIYKRITGNNINIKELLGL
jgi:hypothetical protein